MSKFLLIPLAAAALLTPAGAAPANAAEVCATAPTCAELGYTLTSTTNCVGTPLKCPFDKTKFFCTLKSEVSNYSSPDFSRARSFSSNITYTASQDGCIFGRTSDIDQVGSYVSVNSYTIYGESIHPSWQIYFFCLSKGDRYYVRSEIHNNYFVPLKGN